jgi:predicted nucleic acid-binding protein
VDPDWRAPGLLVHEFTNIMLQYVKQGGATPAEARRTLENGLLLVSVVEREPPAIRVLDIATSLALSAYDASYLAVAEALGCGLATEDRHLLQAAPGVAGAMAAFLA